MTRDQRKDAYSAFKAVRHLDVIHDVRARDRTARVPHVQLILSDLCNHGCNFCAYRDPDYTSSTMFFEVDAKNLKKGLRKDPTHPERNYNPNRMIPTEKALEIIDDLADMMTSGLQFTGGGEPTVHPEWKRILQYALAKGLAISLVTNGVNADNEESAELLAKAAWVRVSLDAGDGETYSKIRHCPDSHFAKALNAIARLRAQVDVVKSPTVIGVGYVVTPDNWKGILKGVKLAKEAGAHNVRISAQFSAADAKLFESFHGEAALLAAEAQTLADDNFTVFNRFGEKISDLLQKKPDYKTCGYQHFTTYIGADLNLYRCCVYAYHPHGLLGSIKDQRFAAFWSSRQRLDGMLNFDARSCDRCQFNTINRFLDYVLAEEDPLHHEFV